MTYAAWRPWRSAGAWVTSPACPGVRMKRKGRPSWSASMWILVVSPPRERPRAWLWPPLSGRRLLVGADQGGVEHEVLVLGIVDQGFENPFPHAGLGPTGEALMHAFPFAVALR